MVDAPSRRPCMQTWSVRSRGWASWFWWGLLHERMRKQSEALARIRVAAGAAIHELRNLLRYQPDQKDRQGGGKHQDRSKGKASSREIGVGVISETEQPLDGRDRQKDLQR